MSDQRSIPVTVTSVFEETPNIRTIEFDRKFIINPGQFCMVWVPGVDEVPMGFSSENSITVQKIGEATEALFSYKEGQRLGIKGPLGNGFSPKGKVLAVAGGVGAAPLRTIALSGRVETFLLGAQKESEIPFRDRLGNCGEVKISTDDGSYGHHGFVTDLLRETDLDEYDTICVCGPEMMMKGVLSVVREKCAEERTQFSLARYMKCGVGICGSCCMDSTGLRVCRDGPVFRGDELLKSPEFGKYSRDASGRKNFFEVKSHFDFFIVC